MTLLNTQKLLIFGLLISFINLRNSTRIKRDFDSKVSDEVSTESDYSIFSTNLNFDLEEDAKISENEDILNKANFTNANNLLSTNSNETSSPELLDFQSDTRDITEEKKNPDNVVLETTNSSHSDSHDDTTVSNKLSESEISETTENIINNNEIVDESTIQFTLSKNLTNDGNEATTSIFEIDESSGDSEQVITFGFTNNDETTGMICPENEFSCDQKCISIDKKCDSVYDCDDHSDEELCSTTEAETTEILFSTTTMKTEELKISITPGVEKDDGLIHEVDERYPLNIQCTVTGPFEDLRAIIYKNQRVVSESTTNTVTVRIDSASANEAGEYLCYGFPADRSTYTAVALKVIVKPSSAPISNNVETVQGNIGSQIQINCDLNLYNNEPVQWRRLDRDIGNHQIYYGRLYMNSLKREDSGEYECFTNDGRIKRYRLIVNNPQAYQYQIRTYVEKPDIYYRNGESITQVCRALTNGPQLTIEWYDPYGQLIRDSNKFRIYTKNEPGNVLTQISTLEFLDLQSNMAGEYKCKAIVNDQFETTSFKLT